MGATTRDPNGNIPVETGTPPCQRTLALWGARSGRSSEPSVRLGAARDVRTGMGILRFVVQGFGWEVGRRAASETIDAVNRPSEASAEDAKAPPPSPRELARRERARKKDEARRRAEIEAELQRLKQQQPRRPR